MRRSVGQRLKVWTVTGLFAAIALLAASGVAAALGLTQEAFPPFSAPVVDEAGVVPDEVERNVSEALLDYQQRTTNQVAVAVVRTTGARSVEEYSLDLAQTWGVGTKEKDNGVLLVIAHDDRKLRIEVGLGLEQALPDAQAQRIINALIVPLLQQGDVGAAVVAGTNAIRRALGDSEVGEPRAEVAPPPAPEPDDGAFALAQREEDPFSWFLPLFVVMAVIGVLTSIGRRGSSGWSGGGQPMFFGAGWGGHDRGHHGHHGGGFFGGGFHGGTSGGGAGGSGASAGGSSGGGGGSFGSGGASGSW